MTAPEQHPDSEPAPAPAPQDGTPTGADFDWERWEQQREELRQILTGEV